MPTPGSGRDRISELLLEIRGPRTQKEAAARSGLAQGTISKAERGNLNLKARAAGDYARKMGASKEQRAELLALCQAIEDLTVTAQTRVVRSPAEAQRRILAAEQQSHEIRSWQCEIVPGLVQHWDYTLGGILRREPTEEWMTARRARLALLDDPGRQFWQLVTEGVLRTVIGSPEVMRTQLAHLVELSRRPNIHLGALPQGRPVPAPAPSFHLYADRIATNETMVGTAFLDARPDLDRHRAAFDTLWSAAVVGDELRELMGSIRL